MNIDVLKNIIHKKAHGENVTSGQLYQMFFFERILERISQSQYRDNIILKGGLYLASLIGSDTRTTKDMDANFKNVQLDKETISCVMNEILSIDLGDDTHFDIIDIEDIQEENEYGGFRVKLMAYMKSLRYHLAVEISTGDKITPKEISYLYQSHFEDKAFPILTYTIETVIAEKFHCIITRGIFNTRMKDYYDIYILFEKYVHNIDFNIMVQAIENTFQKRGKLFDIIYAKEVIEDLKSNSRMIHLWHQFQSKAPYSQEIMYDDLINTLFYIIHIISGLKEKQYN